MEAKEFKPVLIKFDEMEFDRHVHLINSRLLPVLEKIKTEFLKLGIGPLTNEFLEDILFNEMMLIKEKLQENKNMTVQLKPISKLLNEFTEVGNMELSIIMGFPTVDGSGNIVVTDEALSDLRDFHSTYVCTERGVELLELHRKAAAAVNEFYQKAKPNIQFHEIGKILDQDINGNIVPVQYAYDLFKYAKEPQQKVNKSL